MRLSSYFLPLLKEDPLDAHIVSHRLMVRSGLIAQQSSGIYSWLPMGLRILKKIEEIVRQGQDKAGAQEVLMPTVQSADLWRESGRYDAYGQEMLRLKDRHGRDLLYAPTAEEVVTDLARRFIKSYRQLPHILYQIHWKFRDEIRPRFGVMRGREFLMKDAYSLDLHEAGAKAAYKKMMEAYVKTFQRMGLVALPVRAPTGAIGGDLSHEFQILAATGESLLYYDKALRPMIEGKEEATFEKITSLYAMEEELHDPASCPVPEGQLCQARGIEVGHIFYFGTKYSQALGATVMDEQGRQIPLHMGSYGIGVSRLLGAIIEAHHDDHGIIWPESVAPFFVSLINLKEGDPACDQVCEDMYQKLQARGIDVLFDDSRERAGVKFATHDLIGTPWHVRVGPKGVAARTIELKCRKTLEVQELTLEGALNFLENRWASL
jgi:prolyl-tRNA synthetase